MSLKTRIEALATRIAEEFKALRTSKLDVSAYTAADVLTKIKGVDGSGSGLDADLLDGKHASEFAAAKFVGQANIDQYLGNGLFEFDPVPTGTPPIPSPNIRVMSIGNEARNTQMAFNYSNNQVWFRRKTGSEWGAWCEFYHSGNLQILFDALKGIGTLDDNVYVLARTASNWNENIAKNNVKNNVVGMLSWNNYGSNHVIFDFSGGVSPSGGEVDKVNSQVPWEPTFPTLMGWNGVNSYGVRVDRCRLSDDANHAVDSQLQTMFGNSTNANTHFEQTPAGQRSFTEMSNGENAPQGWILLESIRHKNAGSLWGTQYAHGWEDNANRLWKRNVCGAVFGSWVEIFTTSNFNPATKSDNSHTHGLSRHELHAPSHIDGLTSTNFRTTLFGNTNNAYNISAARFQTVPQILADKGMDNYSTMLAWSGDDTHGFISTRWNGSDVVVGAGAGNALSWVAKLWHDRNFDPSTKADVTPIINQTAHGFAVGTPVKPTAAGWVKTKADSAANAGTVGVVSAVIDANNFRIAATGELLPGSWTPYKNYYLSVDTAGEIFAQTTPEIWSLGNIKEFIGSTDGNGDLHVNIDIGMEITELLEGDNTVTSIIISGGNITINQSNAGPVSTPFSYQPLSAILTAIAAVTGDNGVLRKVAGVWSLDNTGSWNSGVQTLTGGTPVWNVNSGLNAIIQVASDHTITFTNLQAGMQGNLSIKCSANSQRITFAGYNLYISQSIHDTGDSILTSAGATKRDKISWFYDGEVLEINGQKDYK